MQESFRWWQRSVRHSSLLLPRPSGNSALNTFSYSLSHFDITLLVEREENAPQTTLTGASVSPCSCRERASHYAGCKLQALVYDILPSTTAVFSYAIGSRKLSANEQLFVGAQTLVSLLQTTQIISHVFCFCFFCLFVFTGGGCASCLHACLGARLLPLSYWYSNLSEGADRVGGQLRGDKECRSSGVTKSGRVWRKVPESDARSVCWLVALVSPCSCRERASHYVSRVP